MPLTARFVRVQGERDRIYVTRSDGSQASWVFPTYGDQLPHDLVHLVVESVFALRQGFWGRVDAGADPGRISDEANRKGGKNKYAAFGADQSELMLAEVLAAGRWHDPEAARLLEEAARVAGVSFAIAADDPRIATTRNELQRLRHRWGTLLPKGTMELTFPAVAPL